MAPSYGCAKAKDLNLRMHAGRVVRHTHLNGAYPTWAGIQIVPVDSDSDAREHLRDQRTDTHQDKGVRFETDSHSGLLHCRALSSTKACSRHCHHRNQARGLHYPFSPPLQAEGDRKTGHGRDTFF